MVVGSVRKYAASPSLRSETPRRCFRHGSARFFTRADSCRVSQPCTQGMTWRPPSGLSPGDCAFGYLGSLSTLSRSSADPGWSLFPPRPRDVSSNLAFHAAKSSRRPAFSSRSPASCCSMTASSLRSDRHERPSPSPSPSSERVPVLEIGLHGPPWTHRKTPPGDRTGPWTLGHECAPRHGLHSPGPPSLLSPLHLSESRDTLDVCSATTEYAFYVCRQQRPVIWEGGVSTCRSLDT